MKQTFHLSIPTPCDKGKKNWNQSPQTSKGIFCQHCSTEVIDFSQKTPQEIKDFFKKNKGHVCGKFYTDQLTTYKITDNKPKPVRTWILGSLLPLLLTGKTQAKTLTPVQQVSYSPEILSKHSPETRKSLADSVEIIGRILSKNESYGIFNAKVGLRGTNVAVHTDNSGRFVFKVSKDELSQHDTLYIEGSFYEEYTRTINLENKDVMSYNMGDIFLEKLPEPPAVVVGTIQYYPAKQQKGFWKRLFGKKE
jgi:hypothetical protein